MIDDGRSKNKVLLCAFPRTGNHWTVLIVSNYYRLLNHPHLDTPVLLGDLVGRNGLARLSGFPPHAFEKGFLKEDFREDYPTFIRVEYSRYDFYDLDFFFNSFDKLVYLWRNPLDVVISHFYFLIRNQETIKKMKQDSLKGHVYFEAYAKATLLKYIAHVKYNKPHADLVLHYDSLQLDPTPFKFLLGYLFKTVNESIFQKALAFSSFHTIHEDETKRKEKDDKFHTRDGRSRQYHDYMSLDLIEYIKKKWKDEGLGEIS